MLFIMKLAHWKKCLKISPDTQQAKENKWNNIWGSKIATENPRHFATYYFMLTSFMQCFRIIYVLFATDCVQDTSHERENETIFCLWSISQTFFMGNKPLQNVFNETFFTGNDHFC